MKKTGYICFIFLLFMVERSIAQNNIFSVDKIPFDSNTEKELIKDYLSGNLPSFTAFLAISSEDSSRFELWEKKFNRFIDDQKAIKPSKKLHKNVKRIYEDLHANFLKKYELLAYFDETFESGTYNCVSAVAMYALTFEALSIPYVIKETPTHVFIIVDPDNTQLLIETTDPVKGFKSFRPGFKENFVNQLLSVKVISEEEVSNKGLNMVFEENYFGGENLTIKELVGIQYYNKGASLYNDQQYLAAFEELSKAQLFHFNDEMNDILSASLINALAQSEYENWEEIKLTAYMDQFMEKGLSKNMIIGEMQRAMNIILIQNRDEELAQKTIDFYAMNAKDTAIIREVKFNYHYDRAVIYYNRSDSEKAFQYASKAYSLNPTNFRSEDLLIESFKLAFRNEEIESITQKMEELSQTYPQLLKNNSFISLKVNAYLFGMSKSFEEKKANLGSNYQSKAEHLIKEFEDLLYDPKLISEAYSNASVYYFKIGYTSKAKALLRKGLELAPNDRQLEIRLKMVNY